ncbi:hypothetical protein [Desulfobulbus alkaliphilus]|uniref:hypothetical protein n=1 Tax=Desulfobulbus alkaliphilus TaxID=869814 RepID=UPI001965C92E|nr:hypothetical protein [Desulfobulbus alkaliphilus]MBM9537554.1 hypothetical protein [Desulfobulbus alkaliphilus]
MDVKKKWSALFTPLIFLACTVNAETNSAEQPIPVAGNGEVLVVSSEQEAETEKIWDVWHSLVSSAVADSIDSIDQFFGDDRFDDENRRSRLFTGIGVKYEQEEGFSLVTDLSLRIALPRLENRLLFFVDGFVIDDDPDSISYVFETAKESDSDVGLRRIFSRDEFRSLNTDIGIRLGSTSQVFGRVRGRLLIPMDLWQLQLSQRVTWFTSDGLVTTSEVRFDRPMANDYLFRSTTSLTWEENESGWTPEQSLALFKELSPRRSWRLVLAGTWPESPHTTAANYSTILTYRQRLHRDWLFLDIAPGVEFPQENNYHANALITAKFEVIFRKR